MGKRMQVKCHTERIIPVRNNLDNYLDLYRDHKQRYEFALNYIKDKKVADIACGVGYGTYLMAKVAKEVHGFDISKDALEHAMKNFSSFNNNFYHADEMSQFTYDVIVSFETIEHMSEIEGDLFLNRIGKSLVKDGLLIISTPINKYEKKDHVTPYHVREYSDEEFPKKLKHNGFEILEMYGQGSKYHQVLFGKSENSGFSFFNLMKLKIHKIIPKKIRRSILKKIFYLISSDPYLTPSISKDNWQNKAVQIAVCRISK